MSTRPVAAVPSRRAVGLFALAGGLGVVVVASLRVGSVPLDTTTVIAAFTAFDGSSAHLIVRSLRLPRTLLGLVVGAGLAVAGVVMQAVTRNPLASPAILGINAGAAFAVVTAVFVLGITSPAAYVWCAIAGALGTSVLVYAIGAVGPGGAAPVKLALAGAVVTALFGSWISAILVIDQQTLDEVRFWLAGSLAGRDVAAFGQVAPLLVIGAVAACGLARQLNALSLGDQVAAGLGQRTGLVRGVAAVAVALLAGAAVAMTGPIGFIGLAVPHAVRGVSGPDHRWLLAYAALAGPLLLLTADIAGRVVARPAEVQVGIVTALLGAPVLIALARRYRVVSV